MLQKLLAAEATGEVWRALEFNVGNIVQLHFLPRTNLSPSRIRKRLQTQIKEWQTSQKPGLVQPTRWGETSDGLCFLVSPHTEGVLPEHYAAQWVQESFVVQQKIAAPDQDIYSLAEKIVPSDILKVDKRQNGPMPLPEEEPTAYKYVIAAARPASASILLEKLQKERRFQRRILFLNTAIILSALVAAYWFREYIGNAVAACIQSVLSL
ncbi:MAG: hypothetical protein LBN39_04400 [Planctomycetaceae bacterium]|nr:hypothetical protein [Planctomycetaceae bacterium]